MWQKKTKGDGWIKMNSGELQSVHKAERNPNKSIIRNAKDHKYIREDL